MDKKIILFLAFVVLLSFTSAQTYAQDSNVDIKVSCLNIDCNTPTQISIQYPNTTLAVNNQTMTTQDSFVNYTFSDTEAIGEYKYYLVSVGGTPEFYEDSFTIGNNFTTPLALSYLGFIVILLFTFFLTMYGASKIEWGNKKNTEGKILTINHFKYLKILLYAISYFELMFLFGLSYKLFNEAGIDGFTSFFNFIYQIFLNMIFPLMIFLIIIIFVTWINDKKFQRSIKLGL